MAGKPARFGFGIVVEKRDVLAAGRRDPLIIGCAETPILAIAEHERTELAFGHFRRPIG